MSSTTPKTILVINDEVSTLTLQEIILHRYGYQTLRAINGKEALECLRTISALPDLIISDTVMPMMDGIELYQAIQPDEQLAAIPFLFLPISELQLEPLKQLRGKDNPLIARRDYLIVPFLIPDFIAVVESLLAD